MGHKQKSAKTFVKIPWHSGPEDKIIQKRNCSLCLAVFGVACQRNIMW